MYHKLKNLLIALAIISFGSNLNNVRASDLSEINLNGPFNVRRVSLYVYAGEGFALSGEPIYFGMEYGPAKNWLTYRRHTDKMAHGWNSDLRYDGLFHYYASKSELANRPPYDDQVKSHTGYTQDEYDDFMDDLYNHGMYKPEKLKAIQSISGGCAGFMFMAKKDTLHDVAYISKKPVTGAFSFPTVPEFNISFKEYFSAYGNILMCVGANLNPESVNSKYRNRVFEDRGIFEPPNKRGYSGLSLMLHGFIGAVIEQILTEKEYMVVSPLPNMLGILERNIQPGDIYVEGKNEPDHIKPLFPKRGGGLDTPCVVKIEPLKRFYTHPDTFALERMKYTFASNGSGPYFPFTITGLSGSEATHTWTNGYNVNIQIPLAQGLERVKAVSFKAGAFVTPGKNQRVFVKLNGSDIASYTFEKAGDIKIIEVPILNANVDIANINFVLPDAHSPASVGAVGDSRLLGLSLLEAMVYYGKELKNLGNANVFKTVGFYGPEGTLNWASDNASLEIPLIGHNGQRVKSAVLETAGFVSSNHPNQTVHISVNGKAVKTIQYDLQNPIRNVHVPLPVDGNDHATISLHTPTAQSPMALGFGEDLRLLGIYLKRVGLSYLQKIEYLGTPGECPYKSIGFSGGEGEHRWTSGNKAEIEIPLGTDPLNRPNLVSFLNTGAFVTPTHSQLVKVMLNGEFVKELQYNIANNNQRIDVAIPQTIADPARIEFQLPNAISPSHQDPRTLGLSVREMLVSYLPRTH